MNRHDSNLSTANRLARAAARLRFVERKLCEQGRASEALEVAREASRTEQRALSLIGYRVATVAAAIALFLGSGSAHAEAKRPKPVVCVDFEVLPTQPGKPRVGICRDGKRPRLFSYWSQVTVDDSDGPRTVTVGG